MQVAKVLADDVPVRLLALQVQVDQVDVQLLQVISELLGRLEGRMSDMLGDGWVQVCRSFRQQSRLSGIIPGKTA